jgi:hypothetical protein
MHDPGSHVSFGHSNDQRRIVTSISLLNQAAHRGSLICPLLPDV